MTLSTAPETTHPEAGEASEPRCPLAAAKTHAPAALLCLGVAAHLLFLLSLRFGWLNPLFNDTMHRFGPGGDFFSIHAAREWPARARTLPERERGSKEGVAAKRAYI